MTPTAGDLSLQAINRMLQDVGAHSRAPIGAHVTVDEIVDCACSIMATDEEDALLRHIETCEPCAVRVQDHLTVAQSWEGEAGAANLANAADQLHLACSSEADLAVRNGDTARVGESRDPEGRMRTLTTRGVELFYKEAGEGHPLLLIHGTGAHADVWSPAFEMLARDHRVIAYDRRAHTRSRAAIPPSAENYAIHGDDAAALLQALGAAPAAVMGWSGGGLVALHLAASHPSLVSDLILEEPPYQLAADPTPDAEEMRRHTLELVREGRPRDAAAAFVRWAVGYRTGGSAIDRFDPALVESLLANAETMLAEMQSGSGEELTSERLEKITCPVTCLVGELTQDAFVAGTDRLLRRLPKARLLRIAEAAHAIHFDQPERFVEAVRSAIAGA
jgi:pimeloyl-ACP methyl ester carboxylesterase